MNKQSLEEKVNNILRNHTISVLNNNVVNVPKKGPVSESFINEIKKSRENILEEEKRTSKKILALLKTRQS
jgi:hypothetical protein